MINLLNVSQLIDNSTSPPTVISSNPTFTSILGPTQTTNYYRRNQRMCNCCMQYPNCFWARSSCPCASRGCGGSGGAIPYGIANFNFPATANYNFNQFNNSQGCGMNRCNCCGCINRLSQCLRNLLCRQCQCCRNNCQNNYCGF